MIQCKIFTGGIDLEEQVNIYLDQIGAEPKHILHYTYTSVVLEKNEGGNIITKDTITLLIDMP